jgi:CheY-like chemotaxis protein
MSPEPAHRRVLVIDDDTDCADTMAMVLRRLGAEVTVAYSGEAGLDAARSMAPDIIFLDIGMPGMDGYQTARELRARMADRAIRIIALTGWGRREDRERTMAAGFDHHLVKPAEIGDLKELLKN